MNEDNDKPEQENTEQETPATPPPLEHAQPGFSYAQPQPEPPVEPGKPIQEYLNFSSLLSHLLKRPMDVLATMESKKAVPWAPLLTLAFCCLLIFGLVIGTFSAGTQLWAAPLKIMGGVAFSAIICLPSLYIFSCLAGIESRFQTISGLLASAISLIALLLVGFAPVIWLFSTSSDSLPFFGFLCLALWLICLGFGFRFISNAAKILGAKNGFHLKVWCTVFLLVTLQMPVTLRPIIGQSDEHKLLNLEEKKFFLTHWGEQITGDFDRPEHSSRNIKYNDSDNPLQR
ncbi:hypothetical protein SAMN02745181_2363 [Rubritalea squalenifaciens DSM 18772]|uniref:Yip1 domain-containing protein n=1 Tax=Rubritalea squalenifaciens DSM 18772 TaxID=1123071 RepID=A0A1M6LD52_9BACT|nr:Yip1 family protein [Rubritalea squalenifaciens]SHJ69087.1 hypothetical protein SAMN02745181_2363 [Rubritalea squalenifaciens DSM 18772]